MPTTSERFSRYLAQRFPAVALLQFPLTRSER
jgi:hypothetical protein